jgi:DNA-binding CsgD family transcriptional regulator
LAAGRALAEGYDWEGVEAVLAAIDRPDADPEVRAQAWLLRARGAWGRGAPQDIAPAIEAGLAACAGRDSDTEVLLRIESGRIPIFVDYDLVGGATQAKAALDLALDRGVGGARARYFYGTATAIMGDRSAFEVLAAAVDIAFAQGDYDTGFTAANNLTSFHESDGDHAIGRRLAEQMRDRAHELGFGVWELSMRYQLAQLDFHDGRCREAVREAEDILRLPVDARTRDAAREVLCMALIDLGRIEEADRLADVAMAEAVDDQQGAPQFLWVKAESALCGGRPADALGFMDAFLTGPETDPNLALGRVTRAWSRFGVKQDPGPAPEIPDRGMLRAVTPEVEGVRALYEGRHLDAAQRFAEAADAWYPFHRRGWIRSSWARGEALRLAGDLDAAIPALREAERRADELGFSSHAAWARHSLRQAGERRAAARGATAGGLTAREAQVLGLVADGLTNAQIADRLSVSPRTVVTQIDSASNRLGATSRTQAAAMYRSLTGSAGRAATTP